MNLSEVVTRIKLQLGLINIATPFENLNETITEIIQNITIPVFSLYNPVHDKMRYHTGDLEKLEKSESYQVYLLPEYKNRKLLYVFDVTYDDTCMSGLGYYGGGLPLMTGDLTKQMMLANTEAKTLSYMWPKMTFHYEHPRKLYLYNLLSSCKVIIYCGFEHDKSLASIPETCRESFIKLALLDVKENLYPTLKQYTTLNTAIGNIDLKLDDWQDAKSQRDELINTWDDTYHLDMQSMYFI